MTECLLCAGTGSGLGGQTYVQCRVLPEKEKKLANAVIFKIRMKPHSSGQL